MATLKEVVQKCIDSEEFFEAVIKDPDAALQRAGLTLSQQDAAALRKMAGNPKLATAMPTIRQLVTRLRDLDIDDWEPGWPLSWAPRVAQNVQSK
jgi:hypothetical protein